MLVDFDLKSVIAIGSTNRIRVSEVTRMNWMNEKTRVYRKERKYANILGTM